MAIRGDIRVNFDPSPRIITIQAPSTELNLQDLVDTLRTIEAEQDNLSFDHLLDASGKQALGGGVFVGITVTLNNALVEFEARSGPAFTLCSISGGNLVAVDSLGATFASPLSPSAYVQVVLTSSSSATLQESADIQYASFNGAVSHDSNSVYSGTGFPIGTPRQPVNNMPDALTIANDRGFKAIRCAGTSMVVDNSLDFHNFSFLGMGIGISNIDVMADANVLNCEFLDATITGTLDGSCRIRNCSVSNLIYINGVIQDSILESGTISLATGEAYFLNCVSDATPVSIPIIDLGGASTTYVSLTGFNGSLKLINKSDPASKVRVDLNGGTITLDSTISAGTFIIRGIGSVINQTTGTASVDVSAVVEGGWTVVEREQIRNRLGIDGVSQVPVATIGMLPDIATSVWNQIVESGLTAEQLLRMLVAVAAGDATGLESGTPAFKSLDGLKTRIAGTYTSGARAITTRDGT